MNTAGLSPAIVVIAFDRPPTLARLLRSLGAAHYPAGQGTPLIISIDPSDAAEVVRLAEEFHWPHGEKEIIRHAARLGLREHVLRCGDLARFQAPLLCGAMQWRFARLADSRSVYDAHMEIEPRCLQAVVPALPEFCFDVDLMAVKDAPAGVKRHSRHAGRHLETGGARTLAGRARTTAARRDRRGFQHHGPSPD